MAKPDFGPEPTKQGRVLIDLLRHRPHAWGAEIGVNTGEAQLHLLRHLPDLKRLYAVDPWLNYPGYRESLAKAKWRRQETFSACYENYLARLLEHDVARKVFILRCFSHQAARVIDDDALNWVFIDANHSYAYVRHDIDLWRPKVRPGGIIAGHDYIPRDRPATGEKWGVVRAVNEVFGDRVHVESHDVWWVEKQ